MIDPRDIRNIVRHCLFREDEDTSMAIIVHGVKMHLGFHPDRLQEHYEAIMGYLKQLPPDFLQSEGGQGMSFLKACVDKDEQQWGEHRDIDDLLCLGLAIKKIRYCLPREAWGIFPEGFPYFVVLDDI